MCLHLRPIFLPPLQGRVLIFFIIFFRSYFFYYCILLGYQHFSISILHIYLMNYRFIFLRQLDLSISSASYYYSFILANMYFGHSLLHNKTFENG